MFVYIYKNIAITIATNAPNDSHCGRVFIPFQLTPEPQIQKLNVKNPHARSAATALTPMNI